MTWFPCLAYPSSQERVFSEQLENAPITDWYYAGPPVKIRTGDAICPICDAIMDNPLTWMTFDYCPVYLLVCPVCSYEDSIS